MLLSTHDDLINRLRQEIALKQKPGGELGVIVLGLECLNRIDGIWGYHIGDKLIREVGVCLQEALREADVVGHIGRGGFGCILPAITSPAHAILAAHKILRVLERPFELVPEQQIYLMPRLGVALFSDHGREAEVLLRHGNVAMHEAQRSGENFVLYQPELDQVTQMQFELHSDLRKAIQDNELMLYYQPQVSLDSGRVSGVEALLRWNSSKRGFVPPDKIVAIAENTGLISALTMWVVNAALRQSAEFHLKGLDLTMAINFSAHNLREPDLVELFERALETWGVPANRIVIELTESAMMEEHPRALETLDRLKALGVALSMDDFGTGYSAMSRLRNLPLSDLKIDLLFVQNMLTSLPDEKIVRSMVGLAQNLGLQVVAEGVEDKATLDKLRELGCDKVQGYYIGRPLPEADFLKLMADGDKKLR
jgi:diguanylate cyclase (GGDEF)-like protein